MDREMLNCWKLATDGKDIKWMNERGMLWKCNFWWICQVQLYIGE